MHPSIFGIAAAMAAMRILILGGSGMLGHKLWQTLAPRFETYVTFRGAPLEYLPFGIFEESRAIGNVASEQFESVVRAFDVARPAVVVNCIGIVKQDPAASNPISLIEVNSLFPHRLARLAREVGARLIHISTDCVFSGRHGDYTEFATPDAEDAYGRSKLLGEVEAPGCLTLRTSMIGRELRGAQSLLEWFLSQTRRVQGFKRAFFSGLTTIAFADVIAGLITERPDLNGLWHVGGKSISKFDLLMLLKQTYGLTTQIEPDETFVCNRSLNGLRFFEATGIQVPSWDEMVARMYADPTPYEKIRRLNDS